MSEKVLGFREKDAVCVDRETGRIAYEGDYYIPADELVLVVSLKWLEKYCLTNQTIRDCVNRDALLLAAKKESEKMNE